MRGRRAATRSRPRSRSSSRAPWRADPQPARRARLESDLLLRLCVVAIAQVREDVSDVGKLLLEVALEGLQPLDQLGTARERAAKEHPRATTPTMGMTVVHVHLLSS